MGRHRTDREPPVRFANVTEVRDAAQIDDGFRPGQPQLHRGNQTVAAGEQFRVLTVLCEELHRFVERRRTEVFEWSGIHLYLRVGSCQLSAASYQFQLSVICYSTG